MSAVNPISRRQTDQPQIETGFSNGCDSFSDPILPRPGFVRWCENAENTGGAFQTRPGFKTALEIAFTDGTSDLWAWYSAAGEPLLVPQGFTFFEPTNDGPYLVFAISGGVFAARLNTDGSVQAPFWLRNIAFSPYAEQVVFCNTIQSQTVVDGIPDTPIAATNILIMQDGGSRACYWDGTTNATLNPQKQAVVDPVSGNTTYPADYNQTRIGLWMAWSGNRLFLSLGNQVFASDLGDPLHFTEELTLTAVPVINYPTAVTGMIDRGTSGNVNSQVIIFTADQTWALWSGVQQRIPDPTNFYPGWIGTPNFQSKIFAGTGCVAGKSVVNHRGLIYWLSAAGLVSFNSINTVTSSQNLPPINYEEAYANSLVGANQQRAVCGAFDKWLLLCVAAGPTRGGIGANSQMQVLNRQPMPVTPVEVNSWQGVWTGVSPVEWASLNVYGVPRAYCLSFDQDGGIRIYQAFQGNRADNGQPVPWMVETPLHAVSGGWFDRANLLYLRCFMQNIIGNLAMKWLWKSTRGQWHEILTTSVTATPGSLLTPIGQFNPPVGNVAPVPTAFVPQSRDISSRNLRGAQIGDGSSLVEARGDQPDQNDRAFAACFQFSGRGSLDAYRLATDDAVEPTEGEVQEPETGYHILPGSGDPLLLPVDPVPAYILADDTPNGAVVAFDAQPPGNFAVAALGTLPYQVPPPVPMVAPPPNPPPSTPPAQTVGFVGIWAGGGTPPPVLFGLNAKGQPLNYQVPFASPSVAGSIPAGNNYNSNLSAVAPLYYQKLPPFASGPQNFAFLMLTGMGATIFPFINWSHGQGVVFNNTSFYLQLKLTNGAVIQLQPGQYTAAIAIGDTIGATSMTYTAWFFANGIWNEFENDGDLTLSGSSPRYVLVCSGNDCVECPDGVTPFAIASYPFVPQ